MKLPGLINRLFRPRDSYADLDERAWADNIKAYMDGVYVSEESALTIAAVWRCVCIIAESIAGLPVEVIEKKGGRRSVVHDHDVAWLLNMSPDDEMTGMAYRDSTVRHALLWGNGTAEIERSLNGTPYAVHMIVPPRASLHRDDDTGRLFYAVQQDGMREERIDARDMLHLRGPSLDGLWGQSIVGVARQSLGLSKQMETFASKFFSNGTHPSGLLTTDATLKTEQVEQLRTEWDKVHKGAERSNKAAILSGGLKWQTLTMPLEDAQFLQLRQAGVLEVARWFGVPPARLAELSRATHTNIEHEQLAFITHCLLPWIRRFETEINLKLFGRNQRGRLSVHFNLDALLRGDSKTRAETLQIYRRMGVLNADEIRELLDRNPIAGGDGKVFIVEKNMTTIEQIENPPEPAAPAAPAEPATADPEPGTEPAPGEEEDDAEGDQPASRRPQRNAQIALLHERARERNLRLVGS